MEISELTPEQRSAFAGALGRIKTEKKAAASRENGKKGGGQMKPLASIACTCGADGLEHRSTCPRGRVIRYRTKRGLPITDY